MALEFQTFKVAGCGVEEFEIFGSRPGCSSLWARDVEFGLRISDVWGCRGLPLRIQDLALILAREGSRCQDPIEI